MNVLFSLAIIYHLAGMIKTIVDQDRPIKDVPPSNNICYYLMRSVFDWLQLDLGYLEKMGFNRNLLEASAGVNGEKDRHYALCMFGWAILTAAVAKLLYYNTLFTYVHAMEIFLSMRPTFPEGDETNDCQNEPDYPAACDCACSPEPNFPEAEHKQGRLKIQ